MRNSPRLPLAALIAAVVVAACSGEAPRTDEGAVQRDSAGVEIVENGAAESLPTWRVSDAPLLQIGAAEGPEEYTLSEIRGVRRLADGRIAVADGGVQSIRLYDGEGGHVRSLGRFGGGEGEFWNLRRIEVWGDTIAGFDRHSQRIEVFTTDGRFSHGVPLREAGGSVRSVVGRTPTGRWVVALPTYGEYRAESGMHTDSMGYVVLEPDGTPAGGGYVYPEVEMFRGWIESERLRQLVPVSRPLGRITARALLADRLVIGTADAPEVSMLEPVSGVVRRLVRWDRTPREIGDEEWAAYRRWWIRRASEQSILPREAFAHFFDRIPRPETRPAYHAIVPAGDGFWLMVDSRPDGPSTWWAHDGEGRALGRVTLPARFSLLEVAGDTLLGVYRDELDVEYVRAYTLDGHRRR